MTQALRKAYIVGQFEVIKKNLEFENLLATAQTLEVLNAEEIENFDVNSKYDQLLNQLTDMGLYLLKDVVLHTVSKYPSELSKNIENIFIQMVAIHDSNYNLEPFGFEKLPKYPHIVPIVVTKSTSFHQCASACLDTYRMRSNPRGILFFVNNVNFCAHSTRMGAQYDKYYMITLYREMGFKIFYFENLTSKDFNHYVSMLINHHLVDIDCLVLAVFTHGRKSNDSSFHGEDYNSTDNSYRLNDRAVFIDCSELSAHDIYFKFNDSNCATMKGKPKIFLLPFCRGDCVDSGLQTIQTDSISFKPILADVIICYGSVDGYQTLRESTGGSWFVREFCHVLSKKAHNTDFETMLYDVKANVMKLQTEQHGRTLLQTPSIVTIELNKILYFNPNYFENT